MASIHGRCTNFGNCPLADSNRTIEVAEGDVPKGGVPVCPACSHALTVQAAGRSRSARPLLFIVVLVALAGLAAVIFLRSRGTRDSGPGGSTGAIAGGLGVGGASSGGGGRVLLRLHGSNTIGAELAPALAQAFLVSQGASDIKLSTARADESEVAGTLDGAPVSIEIAAHGSATAFKDLAAGAADIGMSSRAIKLDEQASLASLGDMSSPASEHVLGLDGIAVVVNESNPIDSLSKGELAEIFSGKFATWADLPGAHRAPKGRIAIYSLDNRSGTYDSFKSMVLGSLTLVTSAARLEDNRKLVDAVAADASGIGFTGLPYVRGVKAVAISDSGARSLLPNRLTVGTEDYPLSRRLYLYTPENPTNPNVRKFVQFAISKAGQDIVANHGFIAQNIAAETPAPAQAQAGQSAPAQYRNLVTDARRLTLDFRFRTGSSDLDNKARVDINRVAGFLADMNYSPKNVMLFGFADNQGGAAPNQKLSETRSDTVAKQLRTAGVDPGVVLGFGSESPVASNQTPEGREKNRRVEIWVKK